METIVAIFGLTAASALLALFLVLSRKGRTEDTARAYLAGFTYVLSDDPDAALDDREEPLPRLQKGDTLDLRAIEALSHETQPPARFTEDLDLFIAPTEENVTRLVQALGSVFDDPSMRRDALDPPR